MSNAKEIGRWRAKQARQQRSSFRWLPVVTGPVVLAGTLVGMGLACIVMVVLVILFGAHPTPTQELVPGLVGGTIILLGAVAGQIGQRLLLGMTYVRFSAQGRGLYLDFHELYSSLPTSAPRPIRSRLKDLCQQATLRYMRLEDSHVDMTSDVVCEWMQREYDEAKKLVDAAIEYHNNLPKDPKMVAQQLSAKLRDEEAQQRRDRVREAAIGQIEYENRLANKQRELGGTTLTDDLVLELKAVTLANADVNALQPEV